MSTPVIMDALKRKRDLIAAKRHEVDILEAEVRGMEEILALIPQSGLSAASLVARQINPGTVSQVAVPTHSRPNAGRQPGAISNRWKKNLLALHEMGEFTSDDVTDLVQLREGRSMRPSEVKRLFEKYADQGHVNVVGDDSYVVPEKVAVRFRIALRTDPDDSNDNSDEDLEHDSTHKGAEPSNKSGPLNVDFDEEPDFSVPVKSKPNFDLDDDIPF